MKPKIIFSTLLVSILLHMVPASAMTSDPSSEKARIEEDPVSATIGIFSADPTTIWKVENLKKQDIPILKTEEGKTVEEKVSEIENDPNVKYTEPNPKHYGHSISKNVIYRGNLWVLANPGQTVTEVTVTSGADMESSFVNYMLGNPITDSDIKEAQNVFEEKSPRTDGGFFHGGGCGDRTLSAQS